MPFKGQMNDLCRKVKWSERPEPRASNIPGLGAWTSAFARPLDRRWRITARGTLLALRVLAAGGWKDFNTGQSASKRELTRGGKPSAPDHESPQLETGKTPPTPWSALPYTVTKNMLLLAGTTPNLRPYSLVFLTCRFDSFSNNTHHGYAGHE